jgi:hypothetical protein
MRWKLLKRRLTISAPRMAVRSHLPWPLRWAAMALMLGFSGAIALWAFELGKGFAGIDSTSREEIAAMRNELAALRAEREQVLSKANTADSAVKAERAAQQALAAQLKQIEAENRNLRDNLGFFERLLPAGTGEGLAIRGLQGEVLASGQFRYQVLIVQSGKNQPDFNGSIELSVGGTLGGKAWNLVLPPGAAPLQVKQYKRIEGVADIPADSTVKQLQVKVTQNGAVKASQIAKI